MALSSHPSGQVRAAVVALLPEFKGLTRALLRELYQLLKTGDVSLANESTVRACLHVVLNKLTPVCDIHARLK